MDKKYYIAYGSNLNVMQMRVRCPGAIVAGKTILKDTELQFRGNRNMAYLTIVPKPGASVPVAIWEVSKRNEEALDWYEGFPRLYYKENIEGEFLNRRTGKKGRYKAFVYIMRESYTRGLPSEAYMRTCMEGYDAFGFDKQILLEAYNKSEEELGK